MDVNFLSMMEAKLPPGFRFHPRDEELVDDYLARKVAGDHSRPCPLLVDVDLNQVEPWDLPGTACVGKEWYFYSRRDRKYATGQRTNRATQTGYWKATGKDRQVKDGRKGGKLLGMRKTLVFYKGRAPKGKKTDWVMHEFRLESGDPPLLTPAAAANAASSSSGRKEDWVLCRVFHKNRGLDLLSKPNTDNVCFVDGDGGGCSSSSLPPLTDTYINFEQPPRTLGNGVNEQVPCFSSIDSHHHGHLPPAATTFDHLSPGVETHLGISGVSSYLHCDPLMSFCQADRSIEAVLDHISKGDGNRAAAGGGCSESFLSQAAPRSMWNPF